MKQIDSAKIMSIERFKEISNWVVSIHNIDQLLELIIETATRMMNAKASSLLLVDKKTDKLYFKVATGEKKEEVKRFEVKIGQGIAGHVAQTGEPLLIPDVRNETRWFKEISESVGFETRSIACVPMKIDNDVIGVVEIIDKVDGQSIEEDDLKLLTVFAELSAVAIANAQKIKDVNKENLELKKELEHKYRIVGNSDKLSKVISDAYKVANSTASTLIVGESGTGKELLARLIHQSGSRREKPMVVLNCAALPETLLEDELFGHEKGAFTGAMARKIGKFELADSGTIFLDEIGEMNTSMQAKLLRILQEGVFYRIGGNIPIHVDVRVISATNRDITKEVEEGRFREDLFYRLNVVMIHMPALRERMEDVPLLAQHFLDLFKGERGAPHLKLAKNTLDKMMQYEWPGNVRELKNAIERAVVMGNGVEVIPEDLPILSQKISDAGIEVGLSLAEALNRFKKDFIIKNLHYTGGNRSHAAKMMDIQRTYLSRLISKYDL